jgi:putative flippase GtrA
VPFARLLPKRFHTVAREAVAFGLIGVVNAIIDFGVFNGLIFLGGLKANAVSTVVATTSSYWMNRRWTYQDRPKTALRREFPLFFAFNLVGLAIQEAVLGLVKYGLHVDESHRLALNLAKCAGLGVATVFRFWSYRRFVFAPAPAAPAATVPAPDVIDDAALAVELRGLTEDELAAEAAPAT